MTAPWHTTYAVLLASALASAQGPLGVGPAGLVESIGLAGPLANWAWGPLNQGLAWPEALVGPAGPMAAGVWRPLDHGPARLAGPMAEELWWWWGGGSLDKWPSKCAWRLGLGGRSLGGWRDVRLFLGLLSLRRCNRGRRCCTHI